MSRTDLPLNSGVTHRLKQTSFASSNFRRIEILLKEFSDLSKTKKGALLIFGSRSDQNLILEKFGIRAEEGGVAAISHTSIRITQEMFA